jgi:ketosteroid isomerase-like protein
MQAWAHGYDKTRMPEFHLEEVQIRMFNDMALIVARTKEKKIKDGSYVIGETRYTDTYIKEKGEWKCVQVQLTRIAN